MSRRNIFAWSLALLVVLLHVGWLLRPLFGVGNWRMANLSGTLPHVQVALIVGWMVFGPGRLPLRMAGVLLLFVIDQAWLANSRMYLYIYADLTMAVGCGVLAVSVGCWLGGWRLMDGSAGSLGNDPPPPLQFTIRTLLVLTTLAAMATLAATSVYRRVESSGSFSTLLRSSVVATGYTLAFLLTAGCVLRHGRWTMRVAVASVTVPALGALTYFLLRATSSIAAGAQWFAIASALLALSLLPVRLLGYRMARVRPRNQWPADSGRPDRGA